MRVFITGDTHGNFRRVKTFCEQQGTTKEDVVIVLGDAGLNYYLDDKDVHDKDFVENEIDATVFCIQGNHEERPYNLPMYVEKEMFGGTVYVEEKYPHIVFAKDGEYYQIGNRKFFVIGGAYSVDKEYRLWMGWKWFKDEQPSEEIKKTIETKLDGLNWNIDILLTHTTAERYEPTFLFLDGIDQSKVDKSTEKWLQEIDDKLTYNHWYFGHYHGDYQISDNVSLMSTEFKEIV